MQEQAQSQTNFSDDNLEMLKSGSLPAPSPSVRPDSWTWTQQEAWTFALERASPAPSPSVPARAWSRLRSGQFRHQVSCDWWRQCCAVIGGHNAEL